MRYAVVNLLAFMMIGVSCMPPAWAGNEKSLPTVERTYLGLSMGALRNAQLTSPPKGTVLRAGAVAITEQQVAAEITKAQPDIQASLKQQQFFVMEQIAIKSLLLGEAQAWAQKTKWTGKTEDKQAMLNAYLASITKAVTVTDGELRAYYEANKDMVGGVPFDAVAKELRPYVLDEKRKEAIDRHVQTLSERMSIEVDAAWVAAQAKTSLDDAVDKARRSGKPAVIDFGAEGCRACDMMTPILKSLQETYGQQCTVGFLNVRNEPILAARYGIESIPVQVFFDKNGHEVYRHIGFFPKEKMLEQLKALGVE